MRNLTDVIRKMVHDRKEFEQKIPVNPWWISLENSSEQLFKDNFIVCI